MRIHLLADPVQAERHGGLQAQLRETLAALRELGVDAGLAASGQPSGCDLLHVFGSGAGVTRAIEDARVRGLPVVLSPRLSPGWNRANGCRARVDDRLLGNRSGCSLDSGYAQIRRALDGATLVLAQDEPERRAIREAFLVDPAKVALVPHGIAARFFDANPAPFRARLRISGCFALMVGQVSRYADQIGLAHALAELALPLVVIGAARERDALYLRELQALRTVTCIGALDHGDPLLASAYAAASVFIHGRHVAGAMAPSEALAAGTPVVGSAALPGLAAGSFALRHVGFGDIDGLKREVSELLAEPPQRDAVRALVRHLGWRSVGVQLLGCYHGVLAAGDAGVSAPRSG